MYKLIDLKKILAVSQIREAENHSIKKNAISSLELMENAAFSFVQALEKQEISTKRIIVVCGAGNNGGDGFAICRLLREKGIDASAVLVKFRETLSKDCETNKNRINDVHVIDSSSQIPDFTNFDIIIDAIFGSGLNNSVTGFTAKIIEAINNSRKVIYSVDVPSGLLSDSITITESIVKSNLVICFQRPKLSFFFPESSPFVQNWEVVNIGLDETFINEQVSNYFILDKEVESLVKSRKRQSHKGTYGHALLMTGSYGKMGAAILSAKACLRSGVGLLTSNVPKSGYEIMQISVPEAMCITDENSTILTNIPQDLRPFDSIGIGPGIGVDDLTANMLKDILQQSTKPLVLDADAINLLSAHHELINLLPENTVLTPHIKEFDRLVGNTKTSLERFKKQIEFSQKYKCVIVLKDAHTCISSQDGKVFFNTSGNQGMATAGTGDVLTGIITGLLAQQYDPLAAAIIGVYFHGKAGDEALKQKCYSSMIASDIIEGLNIEHN